jgi:hypothetical protein
VALQQHEAQLEQSETVWQLSQDVSEQPQVWHAEEEYAPKAKGKTVIKPLLSAYFPNASVTAATPD